MMPSFSTRSKRHTALLVLLGWLFALVAGVANACLLEARITHVHAGPVAWSEAAQASLVAPGDAGVVAGHGGGDPHAARAPCLKACADGAPSLPRQDLTATPADPGPAPLMAILWTASPAATAPRRMDDVQPALPERPVRVRYSRLAL